MIEADRGHVELVRQARAGHRESLDTLAARVRERVYAYFNRVTLDEERSQDLTQETLLAVLESLGTLKRADRFWPWVFRIASNRARQHYRYEARHRAVPMSAVQEAHLPASSDGREEASARLSRKELGELTRQAMAQISERYRMVLALRVFEDMAHAEIATALGCTELGARATFFRAKHALLRELQRRGVHRTALVAALAAFGGLTASSSSSAAATVSASAVAESVVAGLLSAKAKVAAVLVAALVVGAFVWHTYTNVTPSSPDKTIRSVHFAHQAMATGEGGQPSSRSFGCYEQWYHFPEGLGGPFLFRMQRWTPDQKTRLCWWVQNGDAHYYVHSGEKTIYIQNAQMYSASGRVKVLPTDSQAFWEFVRGLEGGGSGAVNAAPEISYERDPATGFLSSRVDRRFPDLGPFKTVYDYSDPDLKLFDAPSGMKVVDLRDAMHQRGWTYFRVEGRLGDKDVSGAGRVPFVYNAFKTYPPWLRLDVDGQLAAADNGTRAWISDGAGHVGEVYPGGGLFKGLPRPWTGFHTLDCVRRDAADERIWFSTGFSEPGQPADVALVAEREGLPCKLRYTVDAARDTVTKIELWVDEKGIFEERAGELRFSYLSEVDEAGEEFAVPELVDVPPSAPCQKASILWPLELIDILGIKQVTTGPGLPLGAG